LTISERLGDQLGFLLDVDRLKLIERETSLVGGARRETVAEHSWHVALAALVLGEYATAGLDLGRVVAMLLLHDLGDIESGTAEPGEPRDAERQEREGEAARRVFKQLPGDQGVLLMRLWREYEEGATPEAAFARGVARLQPMLATVANEGDVWSRHGITADRVAEEVQGLETAAPQLWQAALAVLEQAAESGIIEMPPQPVEAEGGDGVRARRGRRKGRTR
jgi:putative hydrolase of HD superfamily